MTWRRPPLDRKLHELHARVEREHWWFVGRRRVIERLLEAHLPQTRGRLLEVGCGTGGNLEVLKHYGEAVGCDPSAFAVSAAKRQSGCRVVRCGLPDGVPAELGRFEAICLFDVLEHLEDDADSLVALRALLEAEGLLFITVPALSWLWSHHDEAFSHFRRYDATSLRQVLDVAGFETLHLSYFNFLLFPAVAAVRGAGRLFGRKGGSDLDIPTGPINGALARVFGAEAGWVARRRLPIGSSLLAVARRR